MDRSYLTSRDFGPGMRMDRVVAARDAEKMPLEPQERATAGPAWPGGSAGGERCSPKPPRRPLIADWRIDHYLISGSRNTGDAEFNFPAPAAILEL